MTTNTKVSKWFEVRMENKLSVGPNSRLPVSTLVITPPPKKIYIIIINIIIIIIIIMKIIIIIIIIIIMKIQYGLFYGFILFLFWLGSQEFSLVLPR